jgi:DNA replication protein DnaC
VKKINEYEAETQITKLAKNKAVEYIKNFESIKSSKENSIAFLGQHGSGKSHLAIGIGAALINMEICINTIYMPYIEVLQELKSNSMDEENYIKIQSKYTTAELLIIDDLFKDKVKKGELVGELKETDMKHIYPIINYRYINHLPTIYSSECDPDMLMDLDGALAGRILEPSTIVIFEKSKENDYRLRKFI